MKKRHLIKLASFATVCMLTTGCSSSKDEVPIYTDEATTTAITTTVEANTEKESNEVEYENPIETDFDFTTEIESTTEDSFTEISAEFESTTESDSEPTAEETTTVEKTTENETATTVETTKPTETTPTETTPTETTTTETTVAPTTPAETKPAVTATSISATVSGNHYVGDTLSAADFTVTVKMSDGSTVTNPAGWATNTLKLTSEKTTITVAYGNLSTNIVVNATNRPAETTPVITPTNQSYDGRAVAGLACNYIGKLVYKIGGHSLTTGADCSNFVSLIFEQFGIKVSSSVADLYNNTTRISAADARIGDLVVKKYKPGMSNFWGHVGFYLGEINTEYGPFRMYVSCTSYDADGYTGGVTIEPVDSNYEYRRIGTNTFTSTSEDDVRNFAIDNDIYLFGDGCGIKFGDFDENNKPYICYLTVFGEFETMYLDNPNTKLVEYIKTKYTKQMNEHSGLPLTKLW